MQYGCVSAMSSMNSQLKCKIFLFAIIIIIMYIFIWNDNTYMYINISYYRLIFIVHSWNYVYFKMSS